MRREEPQDRLESLASMGEEAPAVGGRFLAGDPLRGLAALTVVLFHIAAAVLFYRSDRQVTATISEAYGWPVGPLVAQADIFVYVFFVLSGYLIGRPFIRAFVAGHPLPSIRRYLRNRLLRIVPPFWGVLTIVLLVSGTVGASAQEVAAVYGFAIAYDFNPLFVVMNHTWTLGVEMVFYLLVPAVSALGVFAARRRGSGRTRLLVVVTVALAIGLVSFLLGSDKPGDREWQHRAECALLAFTPGVILAAIEIPMAPRLRGHRLGPRLALLLIPVSVVVMFLSKRSGIDNRAAVVAVATLGAGILVAAPLVHQWSTGGSWRVLDNRATRWLGQRSYSFYLVHVAIVYHLRSLGTGAGSLNRGFLVMLAVSGPAIIAATIVTHRLLEAPFLRMREPWRRPPPVPGRPSPPA